MEQDAGANFLAFLILALLVTLVVMIRRVFRSAKANKAAATNEPDSDDNSSRGMVWATGSGGDDELKRGRQRKPGRKWVCTRCGQQFTLTVDPATVPVPWWYGEATSKFTNANPAPWACTGCGTYAYTVPR
jgi:rubrerythrin